MKVMKNCALAARLAVHYAPWSALLYFLTCFIPGFFNGCKVLLVQRLVDSGVAYAGTAQGMEGMFSAEGKHFAEDMAVTGTVLVVMLFFWFSSYHLRYTSRYTPSLAP